VRRTRIVATIGPASESDEVLRDLAAAGVDVFRLSMAHGDIPSCIERLRRVRAVAPSVAIMVDIPGPKIRAGSFGTSPVALNHGHRLEIVEAFGSTSTAEIIAVEREGVLANLKVGDRVAIGDGGTALQIIEVGSSVVAEVVAAGSVMGKPGLSFPSTILNEHLPTADDADRIAALRDEEFEILAVSFVRSAFDMVSVRTALGRPDVLMMAKIETEEGINNLTEIVEVTDSLMVARGDLGVRLPIEDVPHLQKRIVRAGVRFARPVVVATQMLETMTYAQVPTRAEVTDVANAVLDGASAVMLSGETAIGHDPVNVVRTMDRIIRRAEESFDYAAWGEGLELQQTVGDDSKAARITAAMTGAAWRAAMQEKAVALVACTRSGMTARAISRFRPPMPIVAITPKESTALQLKVSWGISDVIVTPANDIDVLCELAVKSVTESGLAKSGDSIVVMAGSATGGAQITDTVRMVTIP